MQIVRSLSPLQDAQTDPQDWRERKGCFDEAPGAGLTVFVLTEKSRWDRSPQLPGNASSRIKEKWGRGSPGLCKAGKGGVSAPGETPPSLPWGCSWDEEAPEMCLQAKEAAQKT